jgi:hypothetical protein
MPISWSEPACLTSEGERGFREIVAEGSFADVIRAFARYRADAWPGLCIAFPDRTVPPLYLYEGDFLAEVVSRLFELEARAA